MTRNCRFIAWQPVLTDHQAFTLQALALQSGKQLICYVAQLEDAVRRAQGWKDMQVTTVERHLLPTDRTLRYCFQRLREHRHDIHFFGSPFEQPKMILTLFLAALLGIEFYLFAEPYSPRSEGYFDDSTGLLPQIKARLRPLAYQCYGLLLGRRVRGVFAISSLAVMQYRRSGVAAAKVFPFGYFVPRVAAPKNSTGARVANVSGLRLAFVGALIRRKGLDLLLDAVKRLIDEGEAITLDVYGPGNPESYAFDAVGIRYRGAIRFGHAQAIIAGYDMLVVPSRYDGWGVVVNEALCAGVPVLCSDVVGARTLVETFGAGAVFTANDAGALLEALRAHLHDPERRTPMRDATAAAAAAIQPEVAASYMLAVIEAEPRAKAAIVSPWYRKVAVPHV